MANKVSQISSKLNLPTFSSEYRLLTKQINSVDHSFKPLQGSFKNEKEA